MQSCQNDSIITCISMGSLLGLILMILTGIFLAPITHLGDPRMFGVCSAHEATVNKHLISILSFLQCRQNVSQSILGSLTSHHPEGLSEMSVGHSLAGGAQCPCTGQGKEHCMVFGTSARASTMSLLALSYVPHIYSSPPLACHSGCHFISFVFTMTKVL